MQQDGEGDGSAPSADDAVTEQITRVVVRPIANPMAYGFLGLAVATITEAAFDLHWIPAAQQHQVGLVLVAFAFPVQFLSTIYGFIGRDTTTVSGIGLQSVSWLTFGLLLLSSVPGSRSNVLAVFLFAAGTVLLLPAAGAALTKIGPALVILSTACRFILTGLWEHFGGTAWQQASGWEGIWLFALALYVSLAIELESVRRHAVLPLGRHGSGKRSVTSGLREEIADIIHEPGVREQL